MASEERVSAGVVRRHQTGCSKERGRRCNCTPSYRARYAEGPRKRQKWKTKTFPTHQEAITWLDERPEQEAVPAPALAAGTPVGDVFDRFLELARSGVVLSHKTERKYSASTLNNYEYAMDAVAGVEITIASEKWPGDRVPVADLEDVRITNKIISAVREEKTAAYARLAGAAITAALVWAHSDGIIDYEPSQPRLPAPPPPRKAVLTKRQAIKLQEAAGEIDAYASALVAVLLEGGLRISEALGLRWGDIDGNRLSVNESKTEAGERDVIVGAACTAALERYRAECGDPDDGVQVFPGTRTGRPRVALRKAAKNAGITGVAVTPHLLRHTHFTLLAEAGMPPEQLSRRAGHTRTSTTMDIYVTARPGQREIEAQLVDSVFAG